MKPGVWHLIRGSGLCLVTVLGILYLLATNDRLTGPTSQELIDQLVRRHPLPTDREAFFRRAWWTESEDNRIHDVIERLASDVRRHADALTANSDRSEPCTVACYADVNVIPVGEICAMLFRGYFGVGGVGYKSRTVNGRHKGPDDYFYHFARPNLAAWWEAHRHLDDDEIRLPIKQWRLAQEDAFGYESEQERQRFHAAFEKSFASPSTTRSFRGLRPWPNEPFTSTR